MEEKELADKFNSLKEELKQHEDAINKIMEVLKKLQLILLGKAAQKK